MGGRLQWLPLSLVSSPHCQRAPLLTQHVFKQNSTEGRLSLCHHPHPPAGVLRAPGAEPPLSLALNLILFPEIQSVLCSYVSCPALTGGWSKVRGWGELERWGRPGVSRPPS